MQELSSLIRDWCASLTPPPSDEFYQSFTGEGSLFISEEGANWDFKDRWPFSMSDEYFGGILRLVCAFANSMGGVIIFGVHDAKRTGGHNKTIINMDRFSQSAQQVLGSLPSYTIRSYTSETYGNVDALFVQPRLSETAPHRFLKSVGKYKPGILWIRQNFEVISASPANFPLLFCRAEPFESSTDRAVQGSLPPNPGALKRFIGRVHVMDRLFSWLQQSDEPRNYLHGKGGSGKTSIAYEFARLVKDYGQNLTTKDKTPIENVIFLSAKEKMFSPIDGEIFSIEIPDFSDEADLYRQILYFGHWSSDRTYLNKQPLDQLRDLIIQFFDMTSCLVVIDDIDTLTTKGIDPGSDFIYRTLCRSKLHSKILYTLRNAPSQSLFNAFEVPGLESNDYTDFVRECVKEFNVPPPSDNFLNNDFPNISERRPLVIESIVALVRTAGSYERAVTLFTQHAGDNVRDYVFIREWDSLNDSLSRLLLAALSDLNTPVPFPDLQTVLQAEPSRILDAIGATREMFLKIDDAGTDALFSVAPLTKRFIDSRKKLISGYGVLHERIRNFRKNIQVSSPEVARLTSQIDALIPARFQARTPDKTAEAYRLATGSLPPAVTESPHFRCALGYVACCLPQPKLPEAREAFLYAFGMRVEPSINYMRSWFNAERNSGLHDDWCPKVADLVIEGRTYTISQKIEMIGRKAGSLYARGRERLHTEQTDAIDDLEASLGLHLKCFRLHDITGDAQKETAREYAQNTAFMLFQFLAKAENPNVLWDTVKRILSHDDNYYDPLTRPLVESLDARRINIRRSDQLHRFKNTLRTVSQTLGKPGRWLDGKLLDVVTASIKAADHRCDQLLKERGTTGKG